MTDSRSLSIREALIKTAGTRLRPILMTAIATVCALLPLAAGMGCGKIISSGRTADEPPLAAVSLGLTTLRIVI